MWQWKGLLLLFYFILWHKQSRYTDRYLCIWIIYKFQGFLEHSFCKWAILTIWTISRSAPYWEYQRMVYSIDMNMHEQRLTWPVENLIEFCSHALLISSTFLVKVRVLLLTTVDPHLCEEMQRLSNKATFKIWTWQGKASSQNLSFSISLMWTGARINGDMLPCVSSIFYYMLAHMTCRGNKVYVKQRTVYRWERGPF